MNWRLERKTGWGNTTTITSRVYRPQTLQELQQIILKNTSIIAFGNNKSQGDSSLNYTSIDMKRLDKILSFDQRTGIITAEAGILLKDLLAIIVPKGWMLPVTPGTQDITLGGCVASDVHGKNHIHNGSFSRHILELELVLANAKTIRCRPDKNKDLFQATIGGMGLTGAIYTVTVKLEKIETAYLDVDTSKHTSLLNLIAAMEGKKHNQHMVAWIDATTPENRGILITANQSKKLKRLCLNTRKSLNIPFKFPLCAITPFSSRVLCSLKFNTATNHRRTKHFQDVFYTLETIKNWNRVYGKKGFIQYQCVFPESNAVKGLQELLACARKNKAAAFLTTLKKFGKQQGLISFPTQGYAIAMDIPASARLKKITPLFDQIVSKHNGKIYLTKDSTMTPDIFKKTYPQATQWGKIKKKYDPANKFTSLQAQRLQMAS